MKAPRFSRPRQKQREAFWESRETGYAGKGLCAVKALEAGDARVAERPLELHGTMCAMGVCGLARPPTVILESLVVLQ